MRLWEAYFRLWNQISDDLNEKSKSQQSETKETINREEERGKDYYGFLCDEKLCIESGV